MAGAVRGRSRVGLAGSPFSMVSSLSLTLSHIRGRGDRRGGREGTGKVGQGTGEVVGEGTGRVVEQGPGLSGGGERKGGRGDRPLGRRGRRCGTGDRPLGRGDRGGGTGERKWGARSLASRFRSDALGG